MSEKRHLESEEEEEEGVEKKVKMEQTNSEELAQNARVPCELPCYASDLTGPNSEFNDINVLNLEVFHINSTPGYGEWPRKCFIAYEHGMLYMEVKSEKKKVNVLDSRGGYYPELEKFFNEDWQFHYVLHSHTSYHKNVDFRVNCQKTWVAIHASILHAVLFSIHVRTLHDAREMIRLLPSAFEKKSVSYLRDHAEKFKLQPLGKDCCRLYGFHGIWYRKYCDEEKCLR